MKLTLSGNGTNANVTKPSYTTTTPRNNTLNNLTHSNGARDLITNGISSNVTQSIISSTNPGIAPFIYPVVKVLYRNVESIFLRDIDNIREWNKCQCN